MAHYLVGLKYSDWEANRVAVLAREFATTHGLDLTMFAVPHTVKKPEPVRQPPPEVPRSSLESAPIADVGAAARPASAGWLGRLLGVFRRGAT